MSLDVDALQAKLVAQKRGGYCFEQNAVFRAALEALGFEVTPLIARVVWGAAEDAPLGGRNHMCLRVDLPEGPWLADVGFGGQLASAPLRLVADIEQTTPEAAWRIVERGEARLLQTKLPTGWNSLYRFTLERAEQSDYEVSSWYTSTHPTFFLTTNLLAERLTPEIRLSLFNTKLTRRWPDGRAEVVELDSAEALARTLTDEFGLEPPADAAALLARMPKPA